MTWRRKREYGPAHWPERPEDTGTGGKLVLREYVVAPWIDLNMSDDLTTAQLRPSGESVYLADDEQQVLRRLASGKDMAGRRAVRACQAIARLKKRGIVVNRDDLYAGRISIVAQFDTSYRRRPGTRLAHRWLVRLDAMRSVCLSRLHFSRAGIGLRSRWPTLRLWICRRFGRHTEVSDPLRVLHVVLLPPWGNNRGDAAMSAALRCAVALTGRKASFTTIVALKSIEPRLSKSIVAAVRRHDVVVIGGGGVFMGPFMPWGNLQPLVQELPYLIWSAGYNRNLNSHTQLTPEFIESICQAVRGSAFCSVRDHASAALVRENTGLVPRVICDPGVVLAAHVTGGTSPRHRSAAARSSEKGLVRVGINLPLHGIPDQYRTLATVLPAIRELVRWLTRQRIKVYYFRHTPHEEYAISEIDDLPITVCRAGGSRLLRTYGRMDLVIAGMLHSALFAFGAGVPSICLSYDVKQRAFLELIGSTDTDIPITCLTEEVLRERVSEVLATLADRTDVVRSVRDRLVADHIAFLLDSLDEMARHSI